MSVSIIQLEQQVCPKCPAANGCSARGTINQHHSNEDAFDVGLSRAMHKVQVLIGGAWKSQHNILIERITGGVSNYLYKLSLPEDTPTTSNEPKRVLVRIYGESIQADSDSMIMDILIFALLSEKGIGPQLYGVFPGGRIEEYIESRVLLRTELQLPHMSRRIARIMSKLHHLSMPISKTPDHYFKVMKRNLDYIRREANRLPENVRELLAKYNLGEECNWMRSVFLEEHQSAFPVVFCHNDFQENNLLYITAPEDKDGFRILPIDFEYCCYGFRAFDIANHFNEWCYDYTYDEWPRYSYHAKDYPSRKQQAVFWQSYFHAQEHPDATPDECVGEEVPDDLMDKLEIEVQYGLVLTHLYWTLWSFRQGLLSAIDFGYMEYGIDRLERYLELKAKLPPLV